MKTTIFITLFLGATLFTYGQKADTIVKKTVKLKNVGGTNMSSDKGLFDNLSASTEFTTLVKLIKASGLADQLNTGLITFLAPTDKAFAKLPAGVIDTLMQATNQKKLVAFLNYLVIPGQMNSKDILKLVKTNNGEAKLTTATGGIILARINSNRNILLIDENGRQSVVLQFDISQSNGTMLVLENVLISLNK